MADFGTLPTTVQSLLVAFYTGHSTMTQETRDLLPHHPEGSAKPNNSSRAKVCSSGSCDEQRRKVGESGMAGHCFRTVRKERSRLVTARSVLERGLLVRGTEILQPRDGDIGIRTIRISIALLLQESGSESQETN